MFMSRCLTILSGMVICVNLTIAQSFTEQTGTNNPMDGEDVGFRSKPTLFDIDNDGDADLFIGEEDGTVNYYENTGSATNPIYTERTGSSNPFDGVDVGDRSTVAFVDIDNDGDRDCFIGEQTGVFNFYENTGTASSATFTERTGASNPMNGFTTSGPGSDENSDPKFADLDDDGDWDCISGEGDGTFRYYENTGTASSATFTERTGASNPLNGEDVGLSSSPGFVDVDSDGDWDLFAGALDGSIYYFENTGSSSSPSFTEQTGANNPMDGFSVAAAANITFADVSGDGDTDCFVGQSTGLLNYYTGTDIGGYPLPIVLLNFRAKEYNNSAYISWQTITEINHDFFTIERSNSGTNFDELATIYSKTIQSSHIKDYEYIDEMPLPGRSFYRLKATDFDGSFEYHGVVSVTFDDIQPNILLYPNPISGNQFTVSFSGEQISSFSIVTNSGEIVASGLIVPGINKIHIPIADKGFYLFQIEYIDKTIIKKLIVK